MTMDNLFLTDHYFVKTHPDPFSSQEQLFTVQQIHSAKIIQIPDGDDPSNLGEGDGLMSLSQNPPLMAIKTADCLPVALVGNGGAALVHAGWRGLAQGILDRPELAEIDPIEAWIGPSICEKCYEVGEEFTTNFPNSDSLIRAQGKLYLSMKNEAQSALYGRFPKLKVLVSRDCTRCHSAYHSYRRNKTSARNWTIMGPLSRKDKI